MKPLYLLTSPPPAVPEADAVFQDVARLQARFGGRVLNLYPLPRPSRWLPRPLYGFRQRAELRAGGYDLLHVFFPSLYVFPALRCANRPLVYTITASLDPARRPDRRWSRDLSAVIVSNERDLATARTWGLANARLIRPGIDTARFRALPPPPAGPFSLLVGSAPWTRAQFRTKGLDALLAAARSRPDVRLIFLWRGLWLAALRRRIAQSGLGARCEVLDGPADVPGVLARAHAAVVLAAHGRLVKACPHSLLEALAAGRPVLVSRCIPLADHVMDRHAGVVVASLAPAAVGAAIDALVADYARLRSGAAGSADGFALERFLEDHAALYGEVLGRQK